MTFPAEPEDELQALLRQQRVGVRTILATPLLREGEFRIGAIIIRRTGGPSIHRKTD